MKLDRKKKEILHKVKYLPVQVCFPSPDADPNVCTEAPFDSIDGLLAEVRNGLEWFVGAAGLVAVALLVYAGIMYMLAAGDAEKIDKATKIVTNTIIGLIIIFLSVLIVNFVIVEVLGI